MPDSPNCEGARYTYCASCRGSGRDLVDCHACDGAGGQDINIDGKAHWEPCGACGGAGRGEYSCEACDGTGSIESHCSRCGGQGYVSSSEEEESDDATDGRYQVGIDDDDDDSDDD